MWHAKNITKLIVGLWHDVHFEIICKNLVELWNWDTLDTKILATFQETQSCSMGHEENGGIGITGLKMGLAVSCHIIFSLDIFCKSFVPLPSLFSSVEFVITPWNKMLRILLPRKRLPIFVKWFANILSKNMGELFFLHLA